MQGKTTQSKLIISGKNEGQFQILFTETFKLILKVITRGICYEQHPHLPCHFRFTCIALTAHMPLVCSIALEHSSYIFR